MQKQFTLSSGEVITIQVNPKSIRVKLNSVEFSVKRRSIEHFAIDFVLAVFRVGDSVLSLVFNPTKEKYFLRKINRVA